MAKIIKFPVQSMQRIRNERGPNSVSCIISDRWLVFDEEATELNDGDYFFMSVMTKDSKDNKRKICSLCVSKDEMVRALSHVKTSK